MSMDHLNSATAITDGYAAFKADGTGTQQDFLDIMAAAIDDEFQNGTLSATNVDITTVAGTLAFTPGTGPSAAQMIADACVTYWTNAITPGTAASGPTYVVTAVVNDASKIAAAINNGIMGLTGAASAAEPLFSDFTKVIIDAAKTIIWTVTETDPSVPVTVQLTTTIS